MGRWRALRRRRRVRAERSGCIRVRRERCAARAQGKPRCPASEFRKRTGFRAKVEHAVFVEDEGTADPLRVLSGLAMQAHALGVLSTTTPTSPNVTPTSVTTHDDKVFEADAIVLAPGAWATEKLMRAAPALKHIRAGKGISRR